MNTYCILLAGAVALAFTSNVAGAEPASDVKAAIKKLGEQPNYSWTMTSKTEGSQAGARQGPIEGKSVKDGYTWLKGTSGENSFQAAAKGGKFAVNYADEWVVVDDADERTARVVGRLKGLRDPAGMAGDLASKAKDLKQDGEGVYAGALLPDSARDLFRTLGRRAAEAEAAKGSVKFKVKDGQLAQYEFNVKGTIKVGGEQREVEINRTVTVEFKDVGTTKVTLPDELLKKFE